MIDMELMEMLVQFLCPTSSSASLCQNFISAHQSVMPPFGQYIYFLFFPTVFLLLFLWIVFKDAVHANKGISLIATIAVYVFIIIQGLYPIFLALGELWIVVIFILGFFYLIVRRFRGEGGGGGKGGPLSGLGGGAISYVGRKVSDVAVGEERRIIGSIERRMDTLEKAAHNLEHPPSGTDVARLQDSYRQALAEAETAVKDLMQFNSIGNLKDVTGKAKHYADQIKTISKKVGGRG